MPTVSFRTLGCKLNQAETAVLQEQFAEKGYRLVPWGEPSDVSVLNTCTVTSRSDSKCRQAIHHVLSLHPDTTVIVVGCYSQVAPEELERLSGVDYVFGTHDKFGLFAHFSKPGKRSKPLVVVSPVHRPIAEVFRSTGASSGHTRAFLKIQSGCSRSCAYCIVPAARGPGRSLPLEAIVRQAGALIRRGFREIVLTGTHIGDFGKDLVGRSLLPDLIQAVGALEGLGRIRLSSLDPEDVGSSFLDSVVSNPNVCRHFHLSMQSGSDAVLHAMNRTYTTSAFRDVVEKLAGTLGPVGLGADVITGFPGESDTLFEETRLCIESLPFTYLHVFPFSPRNGTKAASMPNQISPNQRMQRADILRRLASQKHQRFQGQWIGRTVEVLMEGKNRDGWMSGLSSEYVRVEVPYDPSWINRIVTVHVERAAGLGLRGSVV